MQLYLDGELVGAVGLRPGGLGNWDDDFPLTIGNETTGDRPFDGDVLEVAFYDRALSDAEIEDLAATPP